MNVLTVISLLACLLGAGVVAVIRKIRPCETCAETPADWLNDFSMERYRPMLRLAEDTMDPQWVSFQASLTPRQAEHYRTQRCRILRAYLQEINRDFERMMKAVSLLMDPETPHVAFTMQRGRMSFSSELQAAHRQLALYARGAGSLELERLVVAFEATARELRHLLAPAALAA